MDHPILVGAEFALFFSQGLCVCCLLFLWLLRHRRIKVPVYRQRARKLRCELSSNVATHPRAKPDWVVRKVLHLTSHLGGCRQVALVFNRWHGGELTVGKTWVAEIMRKHAAQIREMRRERKRRKPYFVPVGHTWALDLTFIQSPHGMTFTVLGIIDAGSRKSLYLKVLPGKCETHRALVRHVEGATAKAAARNGGLHASSTE